MLYLMKAINLFNQSVLFFGDA